MSVVFVVFVVFVVSFDDYDDDDVNPYIGTISVLPLALPAL